MKQREGVDMLASCERAPTTESPPLQQNLPQHSRLTSAVQLIFSSKNAVKPSICIHGPPPPTELPASNRLR